MKKIFLAVVLLISATLNAQIPPSTSTPDPGYDDTLNYRQDKYTYGSKENRVYATRVLRTPKDTIYSKAGMAIIGSDLWYGDEERWWLVGSAANDGTVTSFDFIDDHGLVGTVVDPTGDITLEITTTVPQYYVYYSDDSGFAGDSTMTFNPTTHTLNLGDEGAFTGHLRFTGLDSGYVTVQTYDSTTSWTLKLPRNDGDTLQFWQTDGHGLSKWASIDTTNISNFYAKVRSLFSAGTGLTYNSATGQFVNTVSGTVTSVGLVLPSSELTVTVSPITTSGNLTAVWSSQSEFTVFRRASGSGTPSFGTIDTTYIASFSDKVRGLFAAGTGLSYNASTGTFTNTGDLSDTNELQTIAAGGTSSPTITLSDGGGTITFASGGIVSLSRSSNTITISATEVDGDPTNELQDITLSGTSTVTVTLSDGGGAFTVTGAGTTVVSRSSNDITITSNDQYVGTVTSALGVDANGFDFTNSTSTTTATFTVTTTVADTRVIYSNGGAVAGDGDMVYNSSTNFLTVPTVRFGASNPYISASSTNDLTLFEGGGGQLDLLQFGGTTADYGAVSFNASAGKVPEFYIYRADDSGFGDLATGGFGNVMVEVNVSDTLDTDVHTVLVNAIDSNIVITLPDESENHGQEYRIKKIDESSDTVFIKSVTNSSTVWAMVTTMNEVVLMQADGSTPAWVRVNNENSTGTVGTVTASGLLTSTGGINPDISSSMAQGKLVGRGASSGTGIFQEITISTGLTLTGTTLTAVDQSASNETETFFGVNNGGMPRVQLSPANTSWIDFENASGITLAINLSNTARPKITIGADDASATNEIQFIKNTNDATSHTVALKIGGTSYGSVQFVEGSNITLTTTGDADDAIVTIAASGSSGVTDVTATGLLTSSGGTTPDISSSIAQARLVGRGGSSGTGIFEAIQVGGSLSFSGTTLNAIVTITNSSDATSHTITLSNSGGSTQFIEGSNITLTTGGSGSAGTVTIATDRVLNDGLYTPTFTLINGASVTGYQFQWLQVGSTVTVSGRVDIGWTESNTLIQVGISLPVASGFNFAYQCAGSASNHDWTTSPVAIRADATNNRAELIGISPEGSSTTASYYVHFTYRIVVEN